MRCQLDSFLHLLYSLTLSHIPLPFRLQPSFSENPSPFTLLPNLSPPYSDRLPLFSDTISLTRITFLSLDSHHSSLIFVVLLISSTHPPLFAACILFSLFGYLPLPISWRSPLAMWSRGREMLTLITRRTNRCRLLKCPTRSMFLTRLRRTRKTLSADVVSLSLPDLVVSNSLSHGERADVS